MFAHLNALRLGKEYVDIQIIFKNEDQTLTYTTEGHRVIFSACGYIKRLMETGDDMEIDRQQHGTVAASQRIVISSLRDEWFESAIRIFVDALYQAQENAAAHWRDLVHATQLADAMCAPEEVIDELSGKAWHAVVRHCKENIPAVRQRSIFIMTTLLPLIPNTKLSEVLLTSKRVSETGGFELLTSYQKTLLHTLLGGKLNQAEFIDKHLATGPLPKHDDPSQDTGALEELLATKNLAVIEYVLTSPSPRIASYASRLRPENNRSTYIPCRVLLKAAKAGEEILDLIIRQIKAHDLRILFFPDWHKLHVDGIILVLKRVHEAGGVQIDLNAESIIDDETSKYDSDAIRAKDAILSRMIENPDDFPGVDLSFLRDYKKVFDFAVDGFYPRTMEAIIKKHSHEWMLPVTDKIKIVEGMLKNVHIAHRDRNVSAIKVMFRKIGEWKGLKATANKGRLAMLAIASCNQDVCSQIFFGPNLNFRTIPKFNSKFVKALVDKYRTCRAPMNTHREWRTIYNNIANMFGKAITEFEASDLEFAAKSGSEIVCRFILSMMTNGLQREVVRTAEANYPAFHTMITDRPSMLPNKLRPYNRKRPREEDNVGNHDDDPDSTDSDAAEVEVDAGVNANVDVDEDEDDE